MRPKRVAVVQARMGSTRLPGKVLADVVGKPMLERVLDRVRLCGRVDEIVVATSTLPDDDAVARFCENQGVRCHRGSSDDVLDRYYGAAKAAGAGIVVRITADCPLLDPDVVDRIIGELESREVDYVSNTIRATYPDGLDAEAFRFEALERAWKEAKKPFEREHVTPYLKHSGKFTTWNVSMVPDLAAQGVRWTVDEPRDIQFVREVYTALSGADFRMADVLSLMKRRPEMARLNASIVSNEGYYRSQYRDAQAGSAPRRNVSRSNEWLQRSLEAIPGGAQTFSKSRSQHIEGISPLFLQKGKGALVWDVDGNEYVDYVQGLLPNILGYGHDGVNAAVSRLIADGHSFSLPHPIEVELAERLTRLIPCAQMVRFGKNGSDATAGAVRAARAFTGRERVACCGYHGWQDWFIGTTTRNAGVPKAVRDLTHPFTYNDLGSLQALLESHPGQFAAVIMEPVNFVEPAAGFLEGVKRLAHQHGALLIFDEICSGFHWGLGGAQKHFGVTPDLACFGKAMGNGFPISCIVGRRDVMKIFEEVFFSFTFGGDVSGMAAAMAVLDVLEKTDALERMASNGRVLQEGMNALAAEAGLTEQIQCTANPRWSLVKYRDRDGKDSLLTRSLFCQEAAKRGILLLATHNMTAATDHIIVERTLEAYASVLKTLSGWLAEKDPSRHLEGKPVSAVFKVR